MCLFWAIWWLWRSSYFCVLLITPKAELWAFRRTQKYIVASILWSLIWREKEKYFLNEHIMAKISIQRRLHYMLIYTLTSRALEDEYSKFLFLFLLKPPRRNKFRNLFSVLHFWPPLGHRGKQLKSSWNQFCCIFLFWEFQIMLFVCKYLDIFQRSYH